MDTKEREFNAFGSSGFTFDSAAHATSNIGCKITSRLLHILGHAALLTLLGLLTLYGGFAQADESASPPQDTPPAADCAPVNLLRDGTLSANLVDPRLVDGFAAPEGTSWNSPLAKVLTQEERTLTFSFLSPQVLRSFLIQADNNDSYVFEGEIESGLYERIWVAERAAGAGLRTRAVTLSTARGPYRSLRVTTVLGDGLYSIAEILASCAEKYPAIEITRLSTFHSDALLMHLIWCSLLIIVLVATCRTASTSRIAPLSQILGAGLVLACGCYLAWRFGMEADIPRQTMQLQRALLALFIVITCLAALTLRIRKNALTIILSGVALLSALNFLVYGSTHFRGQGPEGSRWVHTFDMRIYHPTAKYFPELGYDGVYLASLAAYEDLRGVSVREMSNVRVRDLHNYSVTTAEKVQDQVKEIRDRFSLERWQSFVSDMGYFLRIMGDSDYLGTHADHGGNATPLWMFIAHAILSPFSASDVVLTAAGLIDIVLLALGFITIARVFGGIPALLALALFGSTDFPYFGSHWLGATLRHDWLVALIFGICALKVRRFRLAGFFLALAALIRVFPIMAAAGTFMALGWPHLSRALSARRLPSLHTLRTSGFGAFALSFTCSALVLAALPVAAFSYHQSWGIWGEKIAEHASKPNVNSVSWRTIVAYDPDFTAQRTIDPSNPEPWIHWQEYHWKVLGERQLLYRGGQLVLALVILLLCARAAPSSAAVLSLALVPIVAYPANYYLHFVCLFPLVALSWKRAASRDLMLGIALTLGGLFIVQYFTIRESQSDECFTQQSTALLISILAFVMLYQRWANQASDKGRAWLSR
jgi:hypothetical protein